VKTGIPPGLSEDYALSTEKEIVAILEAMNRCYQVDPRKRSPARDIVSILENTASHA
jgi:hypothetical protein